MLRTESSSTNRKLFEIQSLSFRPERSEASAVEGPAFPWHRSFVRAVTSVTSQN